MSAQPAPAEGIYLQDIYDPRRRISRAYFPAFALLLAIMPIIIFFGVPTVLNLAATGRRGDGLLFGRPPTTYAPGVYPWVYLVYTYVVLVVCINRMRATGRSLWILLLPGYNLYVLFRYPDKAPGNAG